MSVLHRRLIALLAVASFLAGLCLPLFTGHFLVDDDTACQTDGLVELTHQPVAIQVAHPEAPLEHCAICHWQRAISGAHASARTVAVRSPEHGTSVALDAVRTPLVRARHRRSSRAPPSLLLAA